MTRPEAAGPQPTAQTSPSQSPQREAGPATSTADGSRASDSALEFVRRFDLSEGSGGVTIYKIERGTGSFGFYHHRVHVSLPMTAADMRAVAAALTDAADALEGK